MRTRLRSDWKVGTHCCVPSLNGVWQAALCAHHTLYGSVSDEM